MLSERNTKVITRLRGGDEVAQVRALRQGTVDVLKSRNKDCGASGWVAPGDRGAPLSFRQARNIPKQKLHSCRRTP